jgi:hypothetical protein
MVVVGGVLVASANPDGLQYVAAQMGLEEVPALAQAPAWLRAPLATYEAAGVESVWARKAGAGLIGLVLIYGVCALGARKS